MKRYTCRNIILPDCALSYGFSEIEGGLALLHNIADEKRPAFVSRIQHLQKRGFPPGVNTGRGRAARYEAQHMFLLATALQLNELGMIPEKAIRVVTSSLGFLADGVVSVLDPTPLHLKAPVICHVPTSNLEDLANYQASDWGLRCEDLTKWLRNMQRGRTLETVGGMIARSSWFSFSGLIYCLPGVLRQKDAEHFIEFWQALRAWAEPIALEHREKRADRLTLEEELRDINP